MKFRPYVNLRFRSEAQYEDVKKRAAVESPSVNEWILTQLEKIPGLVCDEAPPAPKKVKAKKKTSEPPSGGVYEPNPSMPIGRATKRVSKSDGCVECNSVGGTHQRGCSKGKK